MPNVNAPSSPALGIPILFDYLYWLRDRLARTAAQLDDEAFRSSPVINGRDLRGTLVHELDVELGWRARLRGEPPSAWNEEAALHPEDFATLAELLAHWAADETEMRRWISGLGEPALSEPITVNGLEGYALSMYLLHLVEHGVTEFTSAAAILTEMGRSPGDLGVLDALDDVAPLSRPSPGG